MSFCQHYKQLFGDATVKSHFLLCMYVFILQWKIGVYKKDKVLQCIWFSFCTLAIPYNWCAIQLKSTERMNRYTIIKYGVSGCEMLNFKNL